MPERVGESCTDMISATPVHKVYAGYRDPSQQTSSGNKTYHLQITRNKKIQALCQAFADTWLDDEPLNELQFMGSTCTKDCSGHRAGYAWSRARGGRNATSPFSPSFNKGSAIGTAELMKAKRPPTPKPPPAPQAPTIWTPTNTQYIPNRPKATTVIINEILTLPVNESSGYSLAGSFTHDLIKSKVWLLTELARIAPQVGTVYVLGSWYGNLGVLLALDPVIRFKQLINVETDPKFLQVSKRIHDRLGIGNAEYMLKDANDLDYRQLGNNGVVINTSLTDMPGQAWFDRIPAGTLVVLQSRDHDPGNEAHGTQDIIDQYPLSEIIYDGELKLQDPETTYTRYMVIGVK